MGQIPCIAFLPCPSTINSSLDKKDPLHNSAQIFIKELHAERFSLKVTKNFRGIGTHSIRDSIIEILQQEFELVYEKTKDLEKAVLAIESLGIALSVLEDSGRYEFKISNLHISILELAKDLSEDANISKVMIVRNCKDKKSHKDSREELIQEIKKKDNGKANYTYDFEVFDTDELLKDPEYNGLLTKH